jgi:long-chain acyl-CoA synthetase
VGFQIGQVLRQGALRHGERVACVLAEEARALTYAQLDHAALRVAAHLRAQGLTPGARVALSAANGAPFLAGFFGAAYAGVTVVPLPILSAAPEVALRVRQSGCTAALVDAPREALLRAACPALPVLVVHGEGRIAGGLQPAELAPSDGALDLPAGADALLLFTSGTTGGAKAARITHASLLAHTAALVHHTLQLTEHDVVLGALPWTHSFGLRMSVLAPFYAGAQVLSFARFDAQRTLAALDAGQVTWVPAVPTMFAAWTADPDHHGHAERTAVPPRPMAQGVRGALAAGAPLPRELRDRAAQRLGCPVRQGYGLTEATFSTIDDGRTGPTEESLVAMGAPPAPLHVGAPVWGVELRIRDEAGADLPVGGEGEVWVRGPNVMAGYLDDEAATRAVFDGGWLRTGDLGRVDAWGRLVLVDRLKDLIIRGGANVYPSEVEDALSLHPGVAAGGRHRAPRQLLRRGGGGRDRAARRRPPARPSWTSTRARTWPRTRCRASTCSRTSFPSGRAARC